MAKETTTAPAKQETAVTQLTPRRMALAEYRRNIFHVTPEAGTPLDAILTMRHYFAHVARDFKPRDRIEIDAEDGTYLAEVIVRECGQNWAKVELLWKVEFKAVEPLSLDISGFDIAHRGPIKKWSVIRKDDKQVLKDELETQQAAINWAAEHAKALAA